MPDIILLQTHLLLPAVEPKDWTVEGRGGLESWHSLGYIPYADDDKIGTGPRSRSVSRTVEYAYDDFCIAVIALVLGYQEEYRKYMGRSRNWRNLWNREQPDLFRDMKTGHVRWTEFTGFMQPRLANGTWKYQNTRMCSPVYQQHVCYFDTRLETYEGSPWLYSFFVPHDMSALIEAMGGKQVFVERLKYVDSFASSTPSLSIDSRGPNIAVAWECADASALNHCLVADRFNQSYFHESGIIYMGNEQSFLAVYQFHYAGRPGLSSYWVHQYIPSQFNSSTNG